ncbi:SusD/RagB family nutrient-binding outer membrane lipoprotein [Chitinophaga alhagiae]|uniref:SusD/RagB family nutrient-binding outer membrane lipoprotein n=2 Tax=Chitinophaga alhagiae TaxID=2203219 RepID=A0ABM6WAA7_9BACT|nr:SusD/RagB family nutrient-binding outer membrane lipoprotein [Chitinophaga alhagiae]
MIMTRNIIPYIIAALVILAAGCSKFDEINTNPDKPTHVTSGMLATKLILNITKDDISSQKSFLYNFMLSKYVAWSEFPEASQYNKFGRTSFDGLVILNNVPQMVRYATDEGKHNAYKGLGHFLRAWKFFQLTMQVGDMPYSEALKGESDNVINPKYDTQKEVFMGILTELDSADVLFSKAASFDGDPVYNGNAAKWRKLANSFQLKVLINLYRKAGDTDLKVKERFQQIVSARPVFESNADNFALKYSDKAGQKYPFFKENNQFIIYNMLTTTLIDQLKTLQDRRLFYYAKPSPVEITGGKTANDWTAYKGIDAAAVYSDLSKVASSKDFSAMNERYTEIPQGEPFCLLSFAQLKFILAEGAARGWITGAENYYKQGITAAMEFVAGNTPDDARFHHNMKIDAASIQTYLAGPDVAFGATLAEQVEQIAVQQYLATFLHAPNNGYYEYRRTGYPALPVNPASNQNTMPDRIPRRWLYPQKELDYNGEHVKAAISTQYGGNDDANVDMWILKD